MRTDPGSPKAHVLLVDDDANVRLGVRDYLKASEYQVTEAETCASAHWMFSFTDMPDDHPTFWIRVSVTYAKHAEAWKMTHSHVSLPFDPVSGMAIFDENP